MRRPAMEVVLTATGVLFSNRAACPRISCSCCVHVTAGLSSLAAAGHGTKATRHGAKPAAASTAPRRQCCVVVVVTVAAALRVAAEVTTMTKATDGITRARARRRSVLY
mmetsp:Transcript_16494/g.33317  ORF Transcript_16494/g.33317 Transcript_16494/m.33317 type:complete len:109 (-) Transcript_16494:17-343(-)